LKIFIAGVSDGLGLCLAREFLESGDRVQGIGRRAFPLVELGDAHRDQFTYHQCDTTIDEQVQHTFERLVHEDFIPDAILFCAGAASDDINGDKVCIDKFKDNFELNLFGVISWVERFLPHFIKRGAGTFAAVSSMSIFRESRKKRIGYSASKTALNKTFENFRLTYFESGVRFVVFNMGRMQKEDSIIGIRYSKAAKQIGSIVKTDKSSTTFNIPFSQYVLTRAMQCVPTGFFRRYVMRN
jgi:NAD(P)-dependent dehydrogenase (short-subunit alcohol dehydrogenase family)